MGDDDGVVEEWDAELAEGMRDEEEMGRVGEMEGIRGGSELRSRKKSIFDDPLDDFDG